MEPIAFLNGNYQPAHAARIDVTDAGFVLGVTIAEQMRTFRGVPFRVAQHLNRFFAGVATLGVALPWSRDELVQVIDHVVAHNRQTIDPCGDLGVTLFATPGIYATYADATSPTGPTCGVHTYRLPLARWAHRYSEGVSLRTVSIQQVSSRSWPTTIKCRSRMHYFLAEQQARAADPNSVPLLLTESAHVSETPTANIAAHFADLGLVVPAPSDSLPGISQQVMHELADQCNIHWQSRSLTVEELERADEIILSSTPYCMLPVAQFQDRRFACPGPIFQLLTTAWKRLVDFDFVAQAEQSVTA